MTISKGCKSKVIDIRKAIICVDFDKTITRSDTISSLFDVAYTNYVTELEKVKHSSTVTNLVKQYVNEMTDMLSHWNIPTESIRNGTNNSFTTEKCNSTDHYDPEGLYQLFTEYETLEYNSIQRVKESCTLKGIKKMDLIELGKVHAKDNIMDKCAEVLNTFIPNLHIVSSNWSQLLVATTCQQVLDGSEWKDTNVVANELFFDQNDVSSGDIDLRMYSPIQKKEYVNDLRTSSQHPIIYIGDGAIDLLPMIESDLGIAIIPSNSYGSDLERIANRFGIKLCPIIPDSDKHHTLTSSNPVLYVASNWHTISNFLSS